MKKPPSPEFYEAIQKDVRHGKTAIVLATLIAVVLAGTFAVDPVIIGNAVKEGGIDSEPARHTLFFMFAGITVLLVGAVYGIQQAGHRVNFQMILAGSQITPEQEKDLNDPKKREKTLRKMVGSLDAQIAQLSRISSNAIHQGHKVFIAVDDLRRFAKQSSDPVDFEHQLLDLKRELMDHYGILNSNDKKKEELLDKLVQLRCRFDESKDTIEELSGFRNELTKLLGGVPDPFPLKHRKP